ncbi:MAG: Hsp70 family protein [Cellvibrionales bacterium]|nr:Hsp70 family protein [Cellvibrionales bacterium]
MSQPTFSVGIDLGTTHSVLSYQLFDDTPPELLPIAQLDGQLTITALSQLPSFIYFPHKEEAMPSASQDFPWLSQPPYVGLGAKTLGQKTPGRLIASAKSWLSHTGIDRHAPILPLTEFDDVDKRSPVDASRTYLEFLSHVFQKQHPEQPLKDQQITLTLPASFDPVARELTVEAAKSLGFEKLNLLEEPQAAVYHWLSQHDNFREEISLGDIILVADIGGGTTDFSLVKVADNDGDLTLERIAVGDHLLLGGDNMDLALAYRVKAQCEAEGKKIDTWQVNAITTACASAKETLLSQDDVNEIPISIPSRGSKLFGKTLRTSLHRETVTDVLVNGFFPEVSIDNLPRKQQRMGLGTQGLPYTQDPAITKHLAAFLTENSQDQSPSGFDPLAPQAPTFIKPTAILLNGGVFKSRHFTQRFMAVVNRWLTDAGAPEAKCLSGSDLDHAVAVGASYFGMLKQTGQLRIKAGLSHSYYVGIESSVPAIPGMPAPFEALCIAPFGMEEDSSTELSAQTFHLRVGEPVTFQFFRSAAKQLDQFGDALVDNQLDELTELAPITLTIPANSQTAGSHLSVRVQSKITSMGLLKLMAISEAETFPIELNIRPNT